MKRVAKVIYALPIVILLIVFFVFNSCEKDSTDQNDPDNGTNNSTQLNLKFPYNGETSVLPNTPIEWYALESAIEYNVYFGKDKYNLSLVDEGISTTTANYYSPPGYTFFWCVVAITEDSETISSDIWRYTTVPRCIERIENGNFTGESHQIGSTSNHSHISYTSDPPWGTQFHNNCISKFKYCPRNNESYCTIRNFCY